MTPHTDNSSLSPEHFQACFSSVSPLILEEWQQLAGDRLTATAGDLEQVVDYIATETDRTRTLIRRQLQELYQLALANQPSLTTPQVATRLTQMSSEAMAQANWNESTLKQTIAELEERTEKLLHQIKQETLPDLTAQVKKNPVGSLLAAVGVGFVLGLLFGGGRGR
jgi:ElaB/YqjD/DUF883 family membrane-anchored ribosome-binding protein